MYLHQKTSEKYIIKKKHSQFAGLFCGRAAQLPPKKSPIPIPMCCVSQDAWHISSMRAGRAGRRCAALALDRSPSMYGIFWIYPPPRIPSGK